MAFLESPRFPDKIAMGSAGGPRYHTTVAVTGGGYEARNIDWEEARHQYDATYGVRSLDELEALIEFFHAVGGRANAFRFKDYGDFKSCRTDQDPAFDDQNIGTGDGSTTQFQLRKQYTRGTITRNRDIRKPVAGTVVVGVGGIKQGSGWSVDTTTGIVSFSQTTKAVQAVVTSANVVTVSGDVTGDLSAGDNIEISGSTGNDGVYSIASLTLDSAANETDITVNENLSDPTADGDVLYGQPNDGDAVTAGYEFDVPVRFDTDHLSTVHEDYQAARAEVPLLEIRV